ncbi:S41 family peptidase [Flavobacterium gelatinilyticum]|uniref:S41 family peptidase n=1 Tax=Flavobacterium gelatinilyticum TaxID=3003260 RepID=UPI0024805EC4|nr:S41 family peptidase [Flavobacterium gelatinilyticum]
MRTKLSLLTLGLCCLFANFANAQKLEIESIKKEDYIADLKLMKEIIEKQHPDPFRYISKEQWERNFKVNIQNIQKKQTYLEFLNNLPKIKDGHLSVSAPEEFYTTYFREKLSYFPIPLIMVDNRLFVNIKCSEVPYLSEIKSINGTETPDIIKQISEHIQGEGEIKTGIEEQISEDFPSNYALFIEPYANKFDIEYYNDQSNKELTKTTLKACNYYEIYYRSSQKVKPINKAENAVSIDYQFYKEQLTGKLTINTFDLPENEVYQKFSDFFKRINKEGYKNVIIDVRSNSGGDPKMAAILYSFISQKNFENKFNFKAKSITLTHTENLVDTNGARVNEADVTDYENFLYQRFTANGNMFFGNERIKEGILENFPADKDTFSGNVYVAIGGKTFSAAVYFAKLVQDNKRGVLIGQETGGNANNTFAGYFLNYKLPKTKVILRFSFTDLYFGDNPPSVKRGIFPEINLSPEQIIGYLRQEKDPEINYILEKLIKNK